MYRYGLLLWFFGLFPVAAQTASGPLISGQVVDVQSSLPVAQARVTVQAQDVFTLTDENGHFSLSGINGTNVNLVAAKKGYYYQSLTVTPPATGLTLALSPVPLGDNPQYVLQRPQDCAVCHPRQYNEWVGTPMARGGFNTWVLDLYSGTGTSHGMGGFVYQRDSAHADVNPSSECAACHQPQGWLENPFSALDDNLSTPTPAVAHGISCEVCHKVADVDVGKINYPGLFADAMHFNRPDSGQVQYGRLGDVTYQQVGTMEASYQPGIATEVCGLCHQDKNDPDNTHEFNGITSEPTYVEWAESPYGDPGSMSYTTCVDCHMPVNDSNEACSVVYPTPERRPDQVRSHQILGTTAEYLENAITMQVTPRVEGRQLIVDVGLYNTGTGHHVPTGVTVRNMILLVQASDADAFPDASALPYLGDQVVHELGGVGDVNEGYYAGQPGKFFAKVNYDQNGNGPVFYTEAAGIEFDNRIPALASDHSQYIFALPDAVEAADISVRLIYRRAFRFLTDAKRWQEDGHGNPLGDVTAPDFGYLMEDYRATIPTRGQDAVAIPVLPGPWRWILIAGLLAVAAYAFYGYRIGMKF